MFSNFPNYLSADLERIASCLNEEFAHMSGKTIFLTGGGGFLGYYLTLAPLYWNYRNPEKLPIKVINSDLFKKGLPDWLKSINDSNLKIITFDCIKPLPNEKMDYILHCASIASPIVYREFPIETIEANVFGLKNVLDHAVKKESNVESVLFFSSSEIYGDPSLENIPTAESYNGNVSCTGPRACYDESKRIGETLCASYKREYGLSVKIVRPFNNYGPGLLPDDGRVLADFVNNLLQNEDIVMFSDGKPTRTFCYISDAVTGYYKTLIRGTSGEAYNIGSCKPEISIKDLAKLVVKIGKETFGYKGSLRFEVSDDSDYLTDNPQRRCPSISKAESEIGYCPMISLEQGVLNYIKWVKSVRNNG